MICTSNLTKEFDEVCLLIVQKMTPRGSYNSVDQSQALLSEWGRGEKGLGYCEIPRNLAQPQARHLQRRWQAWTRQGPHLTWIASGLGNQTRPGQQPSSQCQFAEESDCLATEINPDTLVPQPIGTYKRMGGRKVVGLTCESYIIRRRVFVLGTSTSALNVCECFGVRRPF